MSAPRLFILELNCSDTEYIASLRSCIKRGTRPDSADFSNNHVDTTAFWRQAYTRSEEAQIGLRARIAELEARDKHCIAEHITAPVTASSHKKRKKTLASAAHSASSKPPKKARTAAPKNAVEPLDARKDDHAEVSQQSPAESIREQYHHC